MWSAFTALVADGKVYLVLLPVYVTLLLSERVGHWLMRKPWSDRHAASNISITLMFLVYDLLFGAILPVALVAWLHSRFALFELCRRSSGSARS